MFQNVAIGSFILNIRAGNSNTGDGGGHAGARCKMSVDDRYYYIYIYIKHQLNNKAGFALGEAMRTKILQLVVSPYASR